MNPLAGAAHVHQPADVDIEHRRERRFNAAARAPPVGQGLHLAGQVERNVDRLGGRLTEARHIAELGRSAQMQPQRVSKAALQERQLATLFRRGDADGF